jgi:hypothetical protein
MAAKAVKLTHFLARLATDPKQLASFIKDPDKVMKAAGLSKAHQKIVKSNDAKKISTALLKEQRGPVHVVGIVCCGHLKR